MKLIRLRAEMGPGPCYLDVMMEEVPRTGETITLPLGNKEAEAIAGRITHGIGRPHIEVRCGFLFPDLRDTHNPEHDARLESMGFQALTRHDEPWRLAR